MKTETKKKSALHEAIRMRLPLSSVKHILSQGADINELDQDGYSPLVNAIDAQLDEVALFLIDHGADLSLVDSRGANALYMAVMHGSWVLFSRLLELGMDRDLIVDEWPLLNVACSRANKFKRLDLKVTRIVNGKHVRVTDQAEIDKAAGKDRYVNFLKIIEKLLERGADVNSVEGNGQTGIALCASRGDLEIIDYLISQGGDVNKVDKFDLSPLHWAARSGHLDIVKLLTQNGANVNVAEAYGFTPLHEAAENGHGEIVLALLAAGADPTVGIKKNFSPYQIGDTAKDVARKRNLTAIVDLF